MQWEYAAIFDALQQLRESAIGPKVFGADTHRFRLNPPLSELEVREFETRLRVALPREYRGFLIQVGNGGAGPAWGLFRLGEMDNAFKQKQWQENDGFIGALSRPFPHITAWNDLSGKPEYDQSRETDPQWEDEYHLQMDVWEERYWNTDQVDGAIPICHVGCAKRQWLIVTGQEAGNVWDDDRADHEGLKPLQLAGSDRVTFAQWYGSWLDNALGQRL